MNITKSYLLLPCLLLFLMTGCISNSSNNHSVNQESTSKESLRVLYATVEAGSEAVIDAVKKYEKEYGIRIEINAFPYYNLQERVFSELAQRSNYYDLIVVDTPWVPKIIQHLEPLSSYMISSTAENGIQLEDFITKLFLDTSVFKKDVPQQAPPSMETISLEKITSSGFDVWSLPIQSNVLTVSYRKDLFNDPKYRALYKAEYGTQLTIPQTLEEYLNIARFFTLDTNQDGSIDLYGTTLMARKHESNFVDFKSFLSVYGGQIFDEQLNPVFNSEEGVRALEAYGSWINEYRVTPPDVAIYSWDEVAISFGFGQVAMGMNYHDMKLNPEVAGGEVGYFMFPGIRKGNELVRGPHFGSWGIALNKYSDHKQAAYHLAQYLTSSEVQQGYLRFKQHVTRNSAYEAANLLPDLSLREYYQVHGESLRVGVGRPRINNYDQVSEAVQNAIQDYLSGKADAQLALDNGAKKVRILMEQAGY